MISNKKGLIFAILVGIIWGFEFRLSNKSSSLLVGISELGLGKFDFYKIYVEYTMKYLMPYILFQMLYGTYIYSKFNNAGIYYFSRVVSRKKWFIKMAVQLLALTVFYILLYSGAFLIIALAGKKVTLSFNALCFYLIYMTIYSLWLFGATMLINVIAIKSDSGKAFSIICVLEICMVIFLASSSKFEIENINKNIKLLKLNPVSHLIMCIHSSKSVDISEIQKYDIDFSLNESMFIYAAVVCVILLISYLIISRTELINSNEEG